MFRLYFNKRILIYFFLALALLVWLAFYSFLRAKKHTAAGQKVVQSHKILYHAERVLAVASGMELGQRGFALTGNEEFLEPFSRSVAEIQNHYNELRKLTLENGESQEDLKQLGTVLQDLTKFSTDAVGARKRNFEAAAALNSSMQGKRALDFIRKTITTIQSEESVLLSKRIEENQYQIASFNLSFIGFLLLATIILLALLFAINHSLRERNEAEKKLVDASSKVQDLYDHAPCGYHSLDPLGVFIEINNTLLKWLGYQSKEEVLGKLKFVDLIVDTDAKSFLANYSLFKSGGSVNNVDIILRRRDGTEFPVILSSIAIRDGAGNFIKSRSNTFDNTERKAAEIQIKELNRELEAFTYSVSHDLRAPLRSIDGYTRILQEDYSPKLDDEAKRIMNVIINNAKQMGQLIDDLLDFSRLGRKEIQESGIDMESLVHAVFKELLELEGRTGIKLKIGQLLETKGDKDMIRQVWINLVSNAIKYTGKIPEPRIEVSSYMANGEIVYYISDNGVGFDMQYAHKLFGVFQRLHRIQDFSGTGVGLAIVKRIVTRHNGRVWAESQVNKGAKFYFTIPQND